MTTLRAGVLPSELAVCGDVFKILPLSDLHLPINLEAARCILGNRAYLRRMNFVVLLGDQCGSFGTEKEYAAIDGFVRALEIPYIAINGNHEFYFATPASDDPALQRWVELDVAGKRAKLARFQQFFELQTLWRAWHTPLGSFVFLGLDDVENHKPETLSRAQWEFLDAALRVQPRVPAFVFCHAPLMLETRLDMVYYDEERTACVEAQGAAREAIEIRAAPLFWMSGHIHLRADHYLFPAYEIALRVWQVHCPDSWGYSRWLREQRSPQRHQELHSRHLEISRDAVVFITHDHRARRDIARQAIPLEKYA